MFLKCNDTNNNLVLFCLLFFFHKCTNMFVFVWIVFYCICLFDNYCRLLNLMRLHVVYHNQNNLFSPTYYYLKWNITAYFKRLMSYFTSQGSHVIFTPKRSLKRIMINKHIYYISWLLRLAFTSLLQWIWLAYSWYFCRK